jgi:radical SAM-linked protein
MQRMRITFSRGGTVKYLSHLDLMRLWERALRRATIPLAYSQGFNPHPRISMAAPLPLGVTSEAELMDVMLRKRFSPYSFFKVVGEQLPDGMGLVAASEVALSLPSLQSQVRKAEYRVDLSTDKQKSEVEEAIQMFMAKTNLPWQHKREGEVRHYDLRSMVDRLWLIEWHDSWCVIGMILRTDSTATGRAEQVTLALGFPDAPSLIHRARLILAGN